MKYPFLLLWLLFHHVTLPTGFVAGTLIQTPDGYIAVEQLKKGDKIVVAAIAEFYDIYAIKDIKKSISKKIVRITTDNDVLFTSPDQPIISSNNLVKACNLKPGAIIFSMNKKLEVKNVELIDEYNELYTIHLDSTAAFFVSAHHIAIANASRSFFQKVGRGIQNAFSL